MENLPLSGTDTRLAQAQPLWAQGWQVWVSLEQALLAQ